MEHPYADFRWKGERPPAQLLPSDLPEEEAELQMRLAARVLSSRYFRLWLWAQAECQRLRQQCCSGHEWQFSSSDYEAALTMASSGELNLARWRQLDVNDPVRRILAGEYANRLALLNQDGWFERNYANKCDVHGFLAFVAVILGGLSWGTLSHLNPSLPA